MGYALITGAGRGLGRALAQEAARDGFDLILSDLPGDDLEQTAMTLKRAGHVVHVVPCDLSLPGAAARLWEVATKGRDVDATKGRDIDATQERQIDVVVNNAGLGRHGRIGTDEGGGAARDAAVVAVNVTALSDLCALAAAHMRARGSGQVLNIASIAAWMPAPYLATYHASKAYVYSLSRAMNAELRGTGVSVTALCPGPIATEFFDDAGAQDVTLTKLLRPMPAADVAAAGWRAMRAGRAAVITGWLNRAAVWASAISPTWVTLHISGWLWTR